MIRSVFAAAVLAAAAAAQISITAQTIDPPGVVDGVQVGSLAIPAGTDVTAGFNLSQTGAPNPPFSPSSATGAFSIAADARLAEVLLTQSASSPFSNTQTTSTASRGAIEVVCTSATPIDIDVTMIIPARTNTSCARQWGSVTVFGQTTFSTDTTSADCTSDPFQFPPVWTCSQTAPATIGPAGLRIELIGETWSSGGVFSGPCIAGSSAGTTVGVEIRPRPRTTPYGGGCGATMSSATDLLQPSRETISITAPSGLVAGVLLIGTQQVALPLPFPSCVLLTDAIASAPLVFPANGELAFAVTLPPPGLLTTQAGASDGTTVAMSNGLQW